MKPKAYYEKLFQPYPDVLTVKQFRSMLGDMNEKTAFKILRDNLVEYFCIGRVFYIPKVYAIEYAQSEHFCEYIKRRKIYGKKGRGQIIDSWDG